MKKTIALLLLTVFFIMGCACNKKSINKDKIKEDAKDAFKSMEMQSE
ncbi:MAG: hypothetical protein JW871_08940 [Endomicrobiales bacterium]|nr:hypothetical protein [Endomicrobiales bacterium]